MTVTNKNLAGYRTPDRNLAAKNRLANKWGEPLFIADWMEVVFLHFTVDPKNLQPHVPFPLDTWNGKACITLVAFTMKNMRFFHGGKATEWMTKPIANHSFLNLRTYVKVDGEPGIHFICEWLDSQLAKRLGPVTFGLPYRFGTLDYDRDFEDHEFNAEIKANGRAIRFTGVADDTDTWETCDRETFDDFLLERYTAFNARGRWKGLFRVWHEPWLQKKLKDVEIMDLSLLETAPGADDWLGELEFAGGNVSPGATDVWMGRPHTLGLN